MEFLNSIVIEVGKCLWVPIERQIKYLVYYKTNIDNLKNQMNNLEMKKEDVQNWVNESRRKLEEPTKEVQEWLKRANEIEIASRNAGREGSENKRLLKGLCIDWTSRYKVSKEAVKKALTVKELLEKGHFSRSEVSYILPLPSVIPIPSDYVHEGLKPIESAMNQVREALFDENIRTIGLYGMGGVGKTSLMKRLNNELQKDKFFDMIIFVTVSSDPDMRRIQNEIGENLGLKFDPDISQLARAKQLYMRLKQEKSILIILDDVWKRLDVSEVGIPSGTDHKGVKIVLTSRMESVCNQMGTQRNIKMELLSDHESWILFKVKAGDVVDFPTLQNTAKLVMRECQGLPLAIVTVGLSLRMNGDIVIWREALRTLQTSIPNEQIGQVFSSLRFSYDFLKELDIKLCFLFCCLFPEDEIIYQKSLHWYGIGEGFLNVDGTLEDASEKVYVFLKRLKDSGLLLDGEYDDRVKMHDIVRDVAIKIAKDDGHGFFVKTGLGLEEWPEKCQGTVEYKRISLINNKIEMLPAELKCPNLRTLLLQNNARLKNIPDSFFKYMPALLVLDLSGTCITSLPPSLSCLTNLRTLCLNECSSLRDVSLLGELKNLEILLLNKCSGMYELPDKICELINLKLLNLNGTKQAKIQSGVIAKLSRLEILEMRHSFDRWGDEEVADFTEIASLPRLTALQVQLKNEKFLFQDFPGPWKKLNKFDITVAHVELHRKFGSQRVARTRRSLPTRLMSVHISGRRALGNWVMFLLERTEDLLLSGCEGVDSLEQSDVIGSCKCLEYLYLEDSDQMECLVNFQKKVPQLAFANLKWLYLTRITSLKKLCHGVPSEGFFGNLRHLVIQECPKLGGVLFSDNLPQTMQNLEILHLENCHGLINIWGDIPGGSFHNLKELQVSWCTKLKNLFTLSFAQGLQQLENLYVGCNFNMMELIAKEEDVKEELETCKSLFPRLKILSLQSLPELTCFYPGPGNMLCFDFPSLEILGIKGCPELKRLPLDPHSAPNLRKMECNKKWFQELQWDDESIKLNLEPRLLDLKCTIM